MVTQRGLAELRARIRFPNRRALLAFRRVEACSGGRGSGGEFRVMAVTTTCTRTYSVFVYVYTYIYVFIYIHADFVVYIHPRMTSGDENSTRTADG